MGLADEVARRQRIERGIPQKELTGTITEVDLAHDPPRVRVDGMLMPILVPPVAIGDKVRWVNNPDDPHCIGKAATADEITGAGGGVPNIWTCTTLRRGDTSWTSALGDTRTLTANVARHVADGGIVIEPDVLSEFQVQPISGPEEFNGVDVVRWDLDITTWWATPAGELPEDYGHPHLFDWNFRWALLAPHWWGTNDPAVPTISDGLSSPNANGIPLDPSSVGGADWDRLFLRVEYDQSTGDTEAWLAVIDDTTFNLVSQGTVTLAAGAAGSGIQFEDMGADQLFGSIMTGWGPNVLHGVVVHELETGGDGTVGQQLYGFQKNNIDMRGERFTPGRNAPVQHVIGSAMINDGTLYYQSYDNDIAVVPEGAPLWTALPGGTTKPIWTDGADLADPAIAWAHRTAPSQIQVETGVQPQDWDVPSPASPNDQAYIYAVVDRATAGTLAANGWPLNWFPFGPLRP